MNPVQAFFISFIFVSATAVATTMEEDANDVMASITSDSNEKTISDVMGGKLIPSAYLRGKAAEVFPLKAGVGGCNGNGGTCRKEGCSCGSNTSGGNHKGNYCCPPYGCVMDDGSLKCKM
eukprot:scaffold37547_cov75-Cyclotella_meneghiniana.AAC.6